MNRFEFMKFGKVTKKKLLWEFGQNQNSLAI